jgi:hypothetical protein
MIPLEFDFTGQSMLSLKFKNEMVVAEKNKKQGLIDKTGKYITGKDYDRIGVFSDGLAAVEKKDKWGYIDKKLKLQIPFNYQSAEEFKDSIAKVTNKSGQVGFINIYGKMVIDLLYDDAQHMDNGYTIITVNDKKGLVNRNGKIVIPWDCEAITEVNDRILKIEKNSKFAYYNTLTGGYFWKEDEF